MNAELLILQAELEQDDAKAIELLRTALTIAEEQGAVPTSLRAAATLAVRSNADDGDVARATLDALDTRAAYPVESGWMVERSASLKRMLDIPGRPMVQA